jgi:peptidoglycan LD-endopeptidase LytH
MNTFGWPLALNIIRRGLENHTFGLVRRNSAGQRRAHQGWDLKAAPGTPCFAIADGRVADVYTSTDYGLVVVAEFNHPVLGRLFAAYAHLSKAHVKPGDPVRRGQTLGLTGESGNARGMVPEDQHLHFEIRTIARPGKGLSGRISPYRVFNHIPLTTPIKNN